MEYFFKNASYFFHFEILLNLHLQSHLTGVSVLQLGGDPSIYFDYILIFHGPVSRILRHVYVAQLSLVSLWYNEFSAETTTLLLANSTS